MNAKDVLFRISLVQFNSLLRRVIPPFLFPNARVELKNMASPLSSSAVLYTMHSSLGKYSTRSSRYKLAMPVVVQMPRLEGPEHESAKIGDESRRVYLRIDAQVAEMVGHDNSLRPIFGSCLARDGAAGIFFPGRVYKPNVMDGSGGRGH